MSRSRKTVPIHNFACMARGSMKKWKKQCNRSLRRISVERDLGNGSFVYKLIERGTAPDDGKSWAHPEYAEKVLRK